VCGGGKVSASSLGINDEKQNERNTEMIKRNSKIEVEGRLTNDPWGGKSYGRDDVRYFKDDSSHEVHDIMEILNELKDRKVRLTIETLD
jgi:hypothetical protein